MSYRRKIRQGIVSAVIALSLIANIFNSFLLIVKKRDDAKRMKNYAEKVGEQ